LSQVGHQLSSRLISIRASTSALAKILDLSFVLVQNRTVEARERRSALRSARHRADGPATVALAAKELERADALQLLGDGLLAAIDQHAEGAREMGSACAAMLRQRGWDGDDLLADHLEGLIGTGPALTLSPLPVDLEELSNILEGDPVYGGGRIDRRTGEVWPQPAIDYAVEMGDEDESESESSERWLRVECLGSVESYRDMEFFIGAVDDASEAKRLAAAIDGRGAFRRFRDALDAWPEEVDRWYAISEERQRGRARAWLAERGYCVGPTPRA
jgi:hypothetical protein